MESHGQLSPDGRWLAYISDSAARAQNHEPRWRRDGKELFYLESALRSNRLMAVPVGVGSRGGFEADGQRFLLNVQADDAEPTLNVMSSWERAALGSR